eukprot:scaffold45994_cov63-Phaeocystis_antarctica.AAC.3
MISSRPPESPGACPGQHRHPKGPRLRHHPSIQAEPARGPKRTRQPAAATRWRSAAAPLLRCAPVATLTGRPRPSSGEHTAAGRAPLTQDAPDAQGTRRGQCAQAARPPPRARRSRPACPRGPSLRPCTTGCGSASAP